jgi:hypothetical protein
MNNGTLNLRLASAERYYKCLRKVSQMSWLQLFNEINCDPDSGIQETLVLLHPSWGLQDSHHFPDLRGKSSFSGAVTKAKCRSLEIWGYKCPFVDSPIHVDHSFPRAKGGMTHHQNAMYLCDKHNLDKGTDIHMFPWERIETNAIWVKQILDKYLQLNSSSYGEELAFDPKYLKLAT